MASLRSLLSTSVTGKVIQDIELPSGCQHIFQATCWTCLQADWQEICCYAWIVPTGVTRATFELWGGGGAGAGGKCCGFGPHGGSGAYAKKTISVTPGTCYDLNLAPATQCSDGVCGCRGCKTWVTGTGLTNLCAEGGMSGCWCCGVTICCQAFCTCGTDGATATLLNSSISGTTLTIGSVSAGTVEINMKLSGGGTIANTTIVGGAGLSWTVDRTQTVATTTITATKTEQAKAYGGDVNLDGVRGCASIYCIDNACWDKHFIPYPAGLVNQCGGVTAIGARHNQYLEYEACLGGSATGWAFMRSQYVPGLGGTTPHTTAGACGCGTPGRPGLIRITYS